MRFGPLFARGETLATRRNATDGTPPSGVAKNNPHQYTKALWQRMVAVLVAVSMATSLTRARPSRMKMPRVPLLISRRLLLPPMLFRAMRTQAIPELERTTRPMSKAPMLRAMPVLRTTLRPFRAPLSMRCLLAILRMLKK